MAKNYFPPKTAMMKISASLPSWDGSPCPLQQTASSCLTTTCHSN